MKLPEGYVVESVLSPGPVAFVALARGADGGLCVLKTAAIDRGVDAIRNEEAVLRALGAAGVEGVPRLLDTWAEGFALEHIGIPTLRECTALLREYAALLRGGADLRDAVARRGFDRLAAVHAAADARGPLAVVHGDVSPDNLFVARDGSKAVLADFGLARWREGGPSGGTFRGTLPYAAPEVARGEDFDGRADDFSLAASILEVVTGIALRGDSGSKAVMLVDAGTRRLDAAHPWRALAPKLFSAGVAGALLACLAFDPRDRPRETPRPC